MAGVFHLYGIRSHAAKNNIAKMGKGDIALWYSSSAQKMIYGTMQVKDKAFADKTNTDWLAIDFIPEISLIGPVSLESIKQNKVFLNSNIVKQKRISVIEIPEEEYNGIIKISEN